MIERLRRHQLFQLFVAHLKEIIREPAVLFWGIIFPILMSLGLGLAFTKKPNIQRDIALVSVMKDDTAANSNAVTLLQKFAGDQVRPDKYHPGDAKIEIRDKKLGNSTFTISPERWPDAVILLKRGTIGLILKLDSTGRLSYHFDPANPDAQLSFLKLRRVFSGAGTVERVSQARIEPLTVRGTRYIDFLIPGLIAMGLMMSTMWGLSYSIIEKRSKKLLRRMVATPMKKSYFLLSMVTVRMLMNFAEAILLFVFSVLVFHVSIQGNIPALLLFFFIGNLAFAGLAIFISSRTAKTEVGNGLINTAVMPMMVLSGVFFSYHNFPDWAIPIIRKLPLTIVADGVRSIFIEGAGFKQIALPGLALSVFAVITFIIGLKMFRWH